MAVGHGAGCHREVRRWGLPGATEEDDGADPTGAGRGHRLTARADRRGREQLLYLLGEAAEVEHAACCIYLYAAFTLRAEPGGGLTAAQVPVVAGWKRAINRIALQEMIHLALVNNLLAALGGRHAWAATTSPSAPLTRLEIRLTLAPFSEQTLRRFLYIERPEGMDISSIAGELTTTGRPSGADRAAGAAGAAGLLQHRAAVPGIEWGLRGLVDRYGEERVFCPRPTRRRRRATSASPSRCRGWSR